MQVHDNRLNGWMMCLEKSLHFDTSPFKSALAELFDALDIGRPLVLVGTGPEIVKMTRS